MNRPKLSYMLSVNDKPTTPDAVPLWFVPLAIDSDRSRVLQQNWRLALASLGRTSRQAARHCNVTLRICLSAV